MPRVSSAIVLLCVALGASGCADKSGQIDPAQREKVAQWVSKSATKPSHPLDIKFGDQVTLIGYDSSADKFVPGEAVSITWHWRVDKAIGEGFRQFTHLVDDKAVSRVNVDNNGLIRKAFPAGSWEAGTYVKDTQILKLPASWSSPKVLVYLGFWKGNKRLPITAGPKDNANRALGLTLDVSIAEEPPIEIHATRADKPIKLDGKLDEAAWTTAVSSPSFVNTMTGVTAEPKVNVKTLWDDTNLYVAFDVKDDFLKTTFENNDDHLWEQDTVEIMVDPDGDGKNYFELQVAPSNKSFDTRYDSRRVPKPFGHMDWNSGLSSGIDLRGKLNDSEADEGYTAEIAIPWTAFAAGEPKHEAPKAGESWRINFYVMDSREIGQRSVGWSAPRVGDFHMPRRFGKILFDAPAEAAPVASGDKKPADGKAEKKPADGKASEPKAKKPAAEAKAPEKPAP